MWLYRYTVTVQVTDVRKQQECGIPTFYYHDANRKMRYSNVMPPDYDFVEAVVDQGTLMGWIEFHDVEYTAIHGLRWPANSTLEGKVVLRRDRHPMGRMVKFLYDERLKYKREKNAGMSQLCKLVMNAVSFGALIPKMCESKFTMKREEEVLRYLNNQFHEVRRARKCGLAYEVELHSKDMDVTLCKWGSMVLSYSKYLMDRVFKLVGDVGAKAAYTDTDSVVFPAAALPDVSSLFERKFGIPFMGSQLMQFHSEFEMEDFDGNEIKTLEGKSIPTDLITAVKSVYLGKKLYFHLLEAEVDGEKYLSCKFSAKGFTKQGILQTGYELYQSCCAPIEITKDQDALLNGVELLFSLASDGPPIPVNLFPPGCGKQRFVFDFGVGVSTPDTKFTRAFTITREEHKHRGAPKAGEEEEEEEEEDEDVEALGEYASYLHGEEVLFDSDASATP